MKILMIHDSGVTKEVKCGFSWTTFFFGFLVPLIRGDLKWAAILFILSLVLGIPTMGIGGAVCGIVFSFVYNKIYIKELIEKGYKPATEDFKNILVQKNIITG